MAKDIHERFWSKVKITEGCWEWVGSKQIGGYGELRATRTWKVLAHRVSWQLHYGRIPEGFYVCHHCDNRCCVRPDHLFLGTAQDNTDDMIAKGRQIRGGRIKPS